MKLKSNRERLENVEDRFCYINLRLQLNNNKQREETNESRYNFRYAIVTITRSSNEKSDMFVCCALLQFDLHEIKKVKGNYETMTVLKYHYFHSVACHRLQS